MATSKCLGCPAFCSDCFYNSTSQSSNCRACADKFYLVNEGRQCNLNRTCSQGQWFNDTALSCQSCPDRCTECRQGLRNGTVKCTSCTPDAKVDNVTWTCVDKCWKSREYFDNTTTDCVSCANGSFPNAAAQKCQQCTKNCLDCYAFYPSYNSYNGW